MEERIADLLDAKFQEEDFLDCFWLDIKMLPNNKVEVFLDSDSGITFEKCRKVSRYLESFIDEEGWLGEKYVLDVSSPGIGRPLKFPRQYVKNMGRGLVVKLVDGNEDEGTIIAADDEKVTLEKKVRIKEGKKKRTETVQTDFPYDTIQKALVQISFKKKKK